MPELTVYKQNIDNKAYLSVVKLLGSGLFDGNKNTKVPVKEVTKLFVYFSMQVDIDLGVKVAALRVLHEEHCWPAAASNHLEYTTAADRDNEDDEEENGADLVPMDNIILSVFNEVQRRLGFEPHTVAPTGVTKYFLWMSIFMGINIRKETHPLTGNRSYIRDWDTLPDDERPAVGITWSGLNGVAKVFEFKKSERVKLQVIRLPL